VNLVLLGSLWVALAQEAPKEPSAEVVVEGNSAPIERTTSSSVTVVDVDERLKGSSDVASVLEGVPGASVVRLGGLGGWSALSLRGSSARQVQVYLDGVPLNPDGQQVVNLSELPLWAFKRIEVYRGSAPLEFGASSMGGVVHLVSGSNAEQLLGASAGLGSLVTRRATVVSSAPLGQERGWDFDSFVAGQVFSTAGDFAYLDNRTTLYTPEDDSTLLRSNNDKRQFNIHGRLRARTGTTTISVMNALWAREEGIPGHSAYPLSQVRMGSFSRVTAADVQLGEHRTRGRLLLWGQGQTQRLSDPGSELSAGSSLIEQATESYGGRAFVRWIAADWFEGAALLELRNEHLLTRNFDKTLTPESPEDKVGRSAASAGAESVFRALSNRLVLTAVANVHGVWSRSASTDGNTAILVVAPEVGARFALSDKVLIKSHGGKGFRPPDLQELYGDQGVMKGQANLRPEHAWYVDVGVLVTVAEQERFQGRVEAAGFSRFARDLIVYLPNAQKVLIPANFERARLQGLELAAVLRFADRVETSTSATFTDARRVSMNPTYDGKQIPLVPRFEAHHRTSLFLFERWQLGHDVSFTDGNYWDATNWYATPARMLHGLDLRFSASDRSPVVALEVLNVLDTRTQRVAPDPLVASGLYSQLAREVSVPITDFVGYPLPGRTFFFSIKWNV
jgi:vitamin B12 transporter